MFQISLNHQYVETTVGDVGPSAAIVCCTAQCGAQLDDSKCYSSMGEGTVRLCTSYNGYSREQTQQCHVFCDPPIEV